MPEKVSHLKEDEILLIDRKKRAEYIFPDGSGRIVSYHPFNSMQIIFYDVHSSELPDLWQLGFRKGDSGRYLRTLICRRGGCEYTINGKTAAMPAGQVLMDYSVGDDMKFTFTTKEFSGIEITMQVDTLVNESSLFKMLRLVVESMYLPEEDIFDSDGYLFGYSKNTMQTIDKLLASGIDGVEGIVIIAQVVEIGHNLASDLKERSSGDRRQISTKQLYIAEDIYHCLTDNFSTKYTAAYFADKYGVSDTTVKKYFKNVYGYGFKEYQTKVRMEWAAEKLATTTMKVGDISDAVGYAKHTKFCKAFKNYYGVTPLVYRRTIKIRKADAMKENGKDTEEKDG